MDNSPPAPGSAQPPRAAREAAVAPAWDSIAELPVALAVFDRDMRYLAASRRWLRDYGLEGHDVAGKSHYEVFPEISEQWRTVHRRGLAGETVTAQEERFERADSSVQWLNWEVRPWHQAGGAIGGIQIWSEDVTARVQAEAALRERAQEFQTLAEGMPQMVWMSNPDGGNLYSSPRWTSYTGQAAATSPGEGWGAVFHPDDLPRVWGAWRRAITDGEEYTVEGRLRRADGVYRWFLVRALPQRDATGQVAKWIGSCTDIDDLKRAETSLALQTAALEAAANTIVLTDRAGVILWANAALTTLTGFTHAEVVGKTPGDLLKSGQHDEAFYRQMWRTILGGGVWHGEVVNKRKDGSRYTEEMTITPVKNADSEITHFIAVKQDITERKRGEAALRESEDRFRYLFDHSSLGKSITQATGEAQVNAAFAEMLGYAPDEFPTRWQDITPVEDLDLTQRETDALLRGERESTRFTKRFLRKDGTMVWADVSTTLRRDATGAPLYFLTTVSDITARVQMEAALRDSEFFFRESQRVAHIGSYRVDFASDTWKSSEVLDHIFGIDAAYERTGLGWLKIVHPDDQAGMAQYLQSEVLGRLRLFDTEYRIVRQSDDAVRWVHEIGSLETDANERVVAMTGTIQDITDRRAAEDATRVNEQRYRSILETALDGYWLVDLQGRLLEVNAAYARMSGYSVDELLSMRVQDLEAVESPAETAARMAKILEHGQDRFETQHRRKDGTVWHVAASVQFQPVEGGRMVVFMQDITLRLQDEREKAQLGAQLQQAQKMESVGRLAGGVAHDFNNMLGVILGHADLALGHIAAGDPLGEDLQQIRDAAMRSAELTRQLLAFARKQTVVPKVLDLNETVAGMLKMLERLIGEDINLRWHPASDLWSVRVDPSQIDQILANLCVNARDAIAGAGALTIETGHRTFTVNDCAQRPEYIPGEYVMLVVSDDGAGMDAETRSHLFEPFFTTKEMGKGTGLGLATVYGIVHQNGGFVEVYSEPGHGTSFKIYLPRHTGKPMPEPLTDPRRVAPRGHETILVAEDEPGILSLTVTLLERQGYAVLRAATPGEAIRVAREHAGDIHLLMTDVVMPEMNGLELARHLQSRFPRMKCLFMSGYTADVIAHRGALDDGVHFIQKPFSQDALAQCVREALDHRE